jgi:hypothetical protein
MTGYKIRLARAVCRVCFLPIIGKLLGHTQASTTQRYAHLDADPLRHASEAIGARIAAALDGKRGGTVAHEGPMISIIVLPRRADDLDYCASALQASKGRTLSTGGGLFLSAD